MPISIRKRSLDTATSEPGVIVVDGARRTMKDLESLLTVLNPKKDKQLWWYYFDKWAVLDRRGLAQ